MNSNTLYYISKNKNIIIYNDEKVYIKSSMRTHTFKGNGIGTMMQDLLNLSYEGNTLNHFKSELSKSYAPESIEKLLSILIDTRVLTTTELSSSDNNFMYLSDLDIDELKLKKIKDNCTLGIITSKSIYRLLLQEIDALGIIENINLMIIDGSIDKDQIIDFSININIIDYDLSKTKMIHQLVSSSTLSLVAIDEVNDLILSQINTISNELGKVWIKSLINGNLAEIGPLIIPGQTSCYECYKSRLIHNLNDEGLIIFNELKRKNTSSKFGYLSPGASIMIGFLVIELSRYILNLNSHLKNKILSINYSTYDISFDNIIKVSNCKCCSSIV